LSSRDTLRCFNNTSRGTCTNSRSLKRQDLEARVLRAVRDRLFQQEPFDEFCRAFTEQMNRLRREHRVKLAAAPREVAGIRRRSQEILKLLLEGFRNDVWKDELRRLDERRVELEAIIAAAESEPALPVLHSAMADVFHQKVEQLARGPGARR